MKWKRILTIVNLYLILSCIICLITFIPLFIEFLHTPFNLVLFIIFLTLFLITFTVIFTNFKMLLGSSSTIKFIKINKWILFFEIFKLSLISLFYVFTIGPLIMPYFMSDNSFHYGMEFYKPNIVLKFAINSAGNEIFLGINLVPLVVFILLDKIQMKIPTVKSAGI